MTLKLVPIRSDPNDPNLFIPKPNNDRCFCGKKLKPNQHPVWGHDGGAKGQAFDALHEKCLEIWCIKMDQMQISQCVICRRNIDVTPLFPWIKKVRLAVSQFFKPLLPLIAAAMATTGTTHVLGFGLPSGISGALIGVTAGGIVKCILKQGILEQRIRQLKPTAILMPAMAATAVVAFGAIPGIGIPLAITLLTNKEERTKFSFAIILEVEAFILGQQMMRNEEERELLFGASCTIIALLFIAAISQNSRSDS